MIEQIPENVAEWVVLVVDDQPDNCEIVETVFEFAGAVAHRALNGLEALQVLEKLTPTLVLADISMPEMDGWEFIRHVRASPATMTLPVIALTAHAMEGDMRDALTAGFNGYISKPVRVLKLIPEIKDLLHRAKTTQDRTQ